MAELSRLDEIKKKFTENQMNIGGAFLELDDLHERVETVEKAIVDLKSEQKKLREEAMPLLKAEQEAKDKLKPVEAPSISQTPSFPESVL